MKIHCSLARVIDAESDDEMRRVMKKLQEKSKRLLKELVLEKAEQEYYDAQGYIHVKRTSPRRMCKRWRRTWSRSMWKTLWENPRRSLGQKTPTSGLRLVVRVFFCVLDSKIEIN